MNAMVSLSLGGLYMEKCIMANDFAHDLNK